MVFPGHILAAADIVVQIFQFILGVNILGQNGILQILEEVLADDGIFQVKKIPETVLRHEIWHIAAVVVEGDKPDGQVLKLQEVLPEQIGVLGELLTVSLIAALQQLDIGLVKNLVHQGQNLLTKLSPVI